MRQSSIIFFALFVGFVIYETMRGNFGKYLGLLGI